MGYKWKPSASHGRAFAEKMKDPKEKAAYNERKQARADKRRAGSQYDYSSAGGEYIPSQAQHDYAVFDRSLNSTPEHDEACHMVAYGYSCQERVPHDYIHVVNELIRAKARGERPALENTPQAPHTIDPEGYILDNTAIVIGDMIGHLRLGRGRVIDLDSTNRAGLIAIIQFNDWGPKHLLVRYAKLKIYEDEGDFEDNTPAGDE